MSAPIRSTEDILAALREHPEWRRELWRAFLADEREAEEIRKKLLTDDLLKLPAKIEKAELERKEDQKKVWEAIDRLAEAQRSTDATLRETNATLQAFMEGTEKRFGEVDRRLGGLETTLQAFMEGTEKRFGEVDRRLGGLETTLQAFMEGTEKRFGEVDRRLGGLETTLQAFMEGTEKRFAEVDKRLGGLETTLHAFMEGTQVWQRATERRLAGIETKLDEMDGKVTQRDAVEKLDNYLHRQIDPVEVLERRLLSRILATAEKAGAITEEEREQIGDADALAVGEDKQTGEPACAAAEISTTVNVEDVDRAERRAKLFLKAVRAAIAAKPKQWEKLFPIAPSKSYALVVGRRITDEASQEAERKGVCFAKYRNGYDREGR